YRSRLEHFYAKHHEAVARDGPDLIAAKEAFLVEQRAHKQALEAQAASLEVELAGLREQIADAARALDARGSSRVEWGDLGRVEPESGCDGDFWRLTQASARRLFAEVFPLDAFEVSTFGNVKACTAFLYGLSVEEMPAADLDHHDESFPLIVAVRAVKPCAP